MTLHKAGETYKIGSLHLGKIPVQLALVLGVAFLYIVMFRWNQSLFGNVGFVLITVPVILAGWYFGRIAGLASSLAATILNAILVRSLLGENWIAWLAYGWPGNILLAGVGYIAGVLKYRSLEKTKVEKKLRERERHLSQLNILTQNILDPRYPELMYFHLISHLTNLFVADYGHLVLWDANVQQAILMACTQALEIPASGIPLEEAESERARGVLQSKKAIFINDVLQSSQHILPSILKDHTGEVRSALCIPLVAGNEKIGAATILFVEDHSFTPDEITSAEMVGRQAAIALGNVHQKNEIQQRLRESDALTAISRALSQTERISLDHVLQLIVDSARELIPGTEQAVIHLLEEREEEKILIPRAVTGFDIAEGGKVKMHLGEGVAGQVMASGQPTNVANVDGDPRFLRQGDKPRFRSLLVAPVQSGEKKLGTISVQSGKAEAFTDEEMRLLAALGTQASIAIENARLLETTQQGLKEVNALYRITQGLAASLDTEQLMKEVVDLLQQSFGYYHVAILVVDPETEDFVEHYGSGALGKFLIGERLPAGAGIIGHAAATGKPFFTNDVNRVVFYFPHPLLPETQSELAMPIKVENHVMGVLDVQQCPPGRLTERDLHLVGTVAEQLAVALQKASLYSELQSSLAQEQAMRSQLIQSERLALVGRLLASVSHELNNPIQAIQNALFLLQEERGISPQGQQDLQIVLSETERMAGLIDRLRTSYRSTRVEDLQPVQVNQVVEDVYALIATHLRHNKISFEFHPEPDLPYIAALPDQIRQVILNLLMNGVEAMHSGGRLIVSTELDGCEVLLTIADTGTGIAAELLPNIFDAFITSKKSGTGLGLTITRDIVQRHHGHIQAENNAEGGATFKVWFPAQPEEKRT